MLVAERPAPGDSSPTVMMCQSGSSPAAGGPFQLTSNLAAWRGETDAPLPRTNSHFSPRPQGLLHFPPLSMHLSFHATYSRVTLICRGQLKNVRCVRELFVFLQKLTTQTLTKLHDGDVSRSSFAGLSLLHQHLTGVALAVILLRASTSAGPAKANLFLLKPTPEHS